MNDSVVLGRPGLGCRQGECASQAGAEQRYRNHDRRLAELALAVLAY